MTDAQKIITILIVALGTVITRFLPFIAFPADKPAPDYIKCLGRVLPPAALGLLVIYCFKDVSLFSGNRGIPEIISVAVVAVLYFWKRNTLISIAGGTVCYMFLLQTIF